MKEALCRYISNTLMSAEPDDAVQADDELLTVGMLDSLMRLVQFIEDQFDRKIPPGDLILENFQTVNAIVSYLEQGKTA